MIVKKISQFIIISGIIILTIYFTRAYTDNYKTEEQVYVEEQKNIDIYNYQVSKEYQKMFKQPSIISGYQDFDAQDISWKVFISNKNNLQFADQLNG
jgi:hypothetical protein